jgi:plasmid stabilization system protein ParE
MIVWNESAQSEVRDVYAYLLDQSISVADEWLDDLEKKLMLLEQFPEMGRIVPDFYVSFIREVFVGRYRLVYSSQEKDLRILALRPMGGALGRI